MNLYGRHRTTSSHDIQNLQIGNTKCTLEQLTSCNPIDYNAYLNTLCPFSWVQPSVEAGKYNIVETVRSYGSALSSFKMRRSSLQKENYQFVMLPSISTLTPHSGSA